MYYIVNQTNHIIAADNMLLALLSVENIGELHQNIASKDIEFTTPSQGNLDISTSAGTTSYTVKSHTLTGVLGELTLVEIEEAQESSKTVVPEETIADDTFSLIDDEPITFDNGDDTVIEEPAEEKEEEISIFEDETPFDLISDDHDLAEETVQAEKTVVETLDTGADDAAIFIDIEKISQKIGISAEDYNSFLNEYIDTALTLEEDLKSTDRDARSHAISTISHLSNVLHLPVISEIMQAIENADEKTQGSHIQSFYNTLARLTTSQVTQSAVPEEVTAPAPAPSRESFGTIDLSDVKPIHFDFQLEEAANDLSLPVELIEEFVTDFIDQAHTETDKMLEAYEKGDLDTIQKIGHLLKGTSSNLRINPLADTLYKIQFCEESSQLEELIKDYWGHFISFEHQIKLTSK
ncbi:MAG TPA: Hpt domain-containing protein [Sulfurovum sp.]|nr:Hpt domain-containing protein [Sulfurovum sp.]